jgi:hypothetical protein
MQRWEYLILHVEWTSRSEVASVNGRELGGGQEAYTYIARLGDEGWELTGVDQGTLYFKRPKAG